MIRMFGMSQKPSDLMELVGVVVPQTNSESIDIFIYENESWSVSDDEFTDKWGTRSDLLLHSSPKWEQMDGHIWYHGMVHDNSVYHNMDEFNHLKHMCVHPFLMKILSTVRDIDLEKYNYHHMCEFMSEYFDVEELPQDKINSIPEYNFWDLELDKLKKEKR